MKLVRSPKNPILSPTANNWENKAVFNCGVFEYQGHIHLLYRAVGNDGISRFGLARLNGVAEVAERTQKPIFEPDPDSEYETLGVEDPRVIKIKEAYYIIYVAASYYPPIVPQDDSGSKEWRMRVSIAHTYDFRTFVRHGVAISHIDSKNAALFPEKIGGNYILLHRIPPDIRIAISDGDDILRYKERGVVFGPRENFWDSYKVGIGAPPIKSPYGWILFYHGVDDGLTYRLGIALLDLKNPDLILARLEEPIFEPEEEYEKVGTVNSVVFTCGAIEKDNEFLIYYGGADKVIGLATIQKDEVYTWAKNSSTKTVPEGD